ncbi:MAG: four helix bundle protein [Prevotella sp.]|mgnify:CR=1 FL=1|jgi:four helix bundle protein|nr:four helix bundle protein [Prevotella sp.]
MMSLRENIIIEKTESFADRITKMYRYLSEKRQGDKDMLKQIVRSGTSVGANVSEGQFAQSKADFLTKMTIALKEANETRYWLKRLYAYGSLNDNEFESIIKDNEEIINILTTITRTTRENMKKQ